VGQTAIQSPELANGKLDIAAPAELSRNEALSLLRLLSPQASERTHFSASLLSTPNGGQLYVTPNLYG
jgi:hypothetical protein